AGGRRGHGDRIGEPDCAQALRQVGGGGQEGRRGGEEPDGHREARSREETEAPTRGPAARAVEEEGEAQGQGVYEGLRMAAGGERERGDGEEQGAAPAGAVGAADVATNEGVEEERQERRRVGERPARPEQEE